MKMKQILLLLTVIFSACNLVNCFELNLSGSSQEETGEWLIGGLAPGFRNGNLMLTYPFSNLQGYAFLNKQFSFHPLEGFEVTFQYGGYGGSDPHGAGVAFILSKTTDFNDDYFVIEFNTGNLEPFILLSRTFNGIINVPAPEFNRNGGIVSIKLETGETQLQISYSSDPNNIGPVKHVIPFDQEMSSLYYAPKYIGFRGKNSNRFGYNFVTGKFSFNLLPHEYRCKADNEFPETYIHAGFTKKVYSNTCPPGLTGSSFRFCQGTGQWTATDYSECESCDCFEGYYCENVFLHPDDWNTWCRPCAPGYVEVDPSVGFSDGLYLCRPDTRTAHFRQFSPISRFMLDSSLMDSLDRNAAVVASPIYQPMAYRPSSPQNSGLSDTYRILIPNVQLSSPFSFHLTFLVKPGEITDMDLFTLLPDQNSPRSQALLRVSVLKRRRIAWVTSNGMNIGRTPIMGDRVYNLVLSFMPNRRLLTFLDGVLIRSSFFRLDAATYSILTGFKFQGLIDEIGLYSTAFDATSVQNLLSFDACNNSCISPSVCYHTQNSFSCGPPITF